MNRHRQPINSKLAWISLLLFLAFATEASGPKAQTSPQKSDAAKETAVGTSGSGSAENGAKIFVAYGCYECHGYAAQGGAGTGPRLGPDPIPTASMIRELRHPNEMPPYSEKVISDTEIADIHAFLMSLPQPPKADSIAILNK